MNDCVSPNDPLLSYDEALNQLIGQITNEPGIIESVLMPALNSVLAQDIFSDINVPPLAMSSMDGYALNSEEVSDNTPIVVSQRIPAGKVGTKLEPGTAARIFTGAPIPEGADSVVMQERVEVTGQTIKLETTPPRGQNVRPIGNDIKSGQQILSKGQKLRAQDIGIAASIGLKTLPVFEKVRVGMFFTGDELVEPGQPAKPGQIYDSNRYTIFGLLSAMGCEIVDLGLVGDTLDDTCNAMLEASAKADLVITSGGVSVGEEDHVRIAIEKLGQLKMWRLRIKPGKPLAYGNINNTHFIGLPGNPVSVFATFHLFVCPLLKRLQGTLWKKPVGLPVTAGFDWLKPDSRREFLRARIETAADGIPFANIHPNQDSGVLTSTVWADGFIEVPENTTISKGELVEYHSFANFTD